jgi:hypothetical protein
MCNKIYSITMKGEGKNVATNQVPKWSNFTALSLLAVPHVGCLSKQNMIIQLRAH